MKLNLLFGPTCSGKTSWSKTFIKNNPDWYRISYDDLIVMIKGRFVTIDHFDRQLIRRAIQTILRDIKVCGHSIIVDGCPMNLRSLIEYLDVSDGDDAEFQITLFECSNRTSLKRNSQREDKREGSYILNYNGLYRKFVTSDVFRTFITEHNVDVKMVTDDIDHRATSAKLSENNMNNVCEI